MKVLFTASECSPFVKIGGLADVVGSLPKSLKQQGVDVRICLPLYSTIDTSNLKLVGEFNYKGEEVKIWESFLPNSDVLIYFLENRKYLTKEVYSCGIEDIHKYLFFSQAVLQSCLELNWMPDIFHCHDWHTGMVPFFVKTSDEFKDKKTIFTIHNLSMQGQWNEKEIMEFLKDFSKYPQLKIKDKYRAFNIMQQGIISSDVISTVSPTYSREILTEEHGFRLEEDLEKKDTVVGILNGIDTDLFNPKTDKSLMNNYSDILGKEKNKAYLQEILGLEQDLKKPLIGFVSRLAWQKGVDLIEDSVAEIMDLGCQLVILGTGEKEHERKLSVLSKRYQNMSANIRFDLGMAKRIYAGSDILLVPSRFEPCGLVQMIAQRYGSIPVARKTGGLADSIKEEETGFLFDKFDKQPFLTSLKKCLFFFHNKEKWNEIVSNAMKEDFSWDNSSREYIKIYNNLLNEI